ncbi:MAG: alpha/beta hydrolase [Labilithrix sp.]|nr:alpha/beta hydrolase [Labilithrix sp.]
MTKDSVSPNTIRVDANGLTHRVLEWSPSVATNASATTVVLVHGYMDAAGTWDRVAPALAERGHRVLAPDMRGFGDGDRAPRGSYYHFADYIADLAGLVEALSPGEPVAVVGHSMGGTIATLYAGAFPENVLRLANLEGLGPPDNPWEVGPTRMRRWVEELRGTRARGEPAPLRREDARRRLVTNHPSVPREVLDHRLPHLVREVTDADGASRVVWRFDPLHRTTSPVPFFAKLFVEFARLVTCPVLFVSGGATGFHVPDEDDRLAAFAHVDRATLEGAGHMMHWTQPDALAALLVDFL